MAEKPTPAADYNAQTERSVGQSRRYKCLLVRGIPSGYDCKDIEKAFPKDCHQSVSVSSGRSATSTEAIVTLPAECTTPEKIELEPGLSHSSVHVMFTESAKLQLEATVPLSSFTNSIYKQAQQLGVSCQLHGENTIVATGTCQQLHKFRDYLTSLLSRYDFDVQPGPPHQVQGYSPHMQQQHQAGLAPLQNKATCSVASKPTPPLNAQSVSNLNTDVLLLMSKLPHINTPGVEYSPQQGQVLILGDSKEEQEAYIGTFQSAYQKILQTLKADAIEVPAEYPKEEIDSLVAHYNQQYNQCHFSLNEQSSTVKIVSVSSRQFDQAKKFLFDKLCHPVIRATEVLTLPGGQTLTVKKGDLAQEEVTVIVNAANSQLNHSGGVAAALNAASNGELQHHSDKHISHNGPVAVGSVAQTLAGGKLKCKYVVHAVGPNASEPGMNDPMCGQLIFQAVTKALSKAQHLKANSIAFPALSTGIFGVSRSTSAAAMMKAIENYTVTKKSKLKDIRIVIIDAPTHTCFAQELISRREKQATSTSAAGTAQGPPPPTTSVVSPGTARGPQAATPGGSGVIVTQFNSTTSSANIQPALFSTRTGQAEMMPTTNQPTGTSSTLAMIGGAQFPPPSHPQHQYPPSAHLLQHYPPPGMGWSPTHPQQQYRPTTDPQQQYRPTTDPQQQYPPTTDPHRQYLPPTDPQQQYPPTTDPQQQYLSPTDPQQQQYLPPAHPQYPTPTHPKQSGQHSSLTPPGLPPGRSQGEPVAALNNPAPKEKQLAANFSGPSGSSGGASGDSPATPSDVPAPSAMPKADDCPICLAKIVDSVKTRCCQQTFCKSCLDTALTHSPFCPTCKIPLRRIVGNQPDGTMNHHTSLLSLPGYEGCGSITINYHIPSGIQGPNHPNPGKRFTGTSRTAYLPDNKEGREVLALLKKAFESRLVFTVGTSVTSGATDTVVWNDIHHKTSTSGGIAHYGYPDPTYLTRIKDDLKAKGIY